MDAFIVVPVYNEWPHLKPVLDSLKARFPHILVVDDGSEDKGFLQHLKGERIPYLSFPFNMGHWAALQAGFRYALAMGHEVAVSFDGDGQHLPEEIPSLLKLVDEGCDIVIGCSHTRAGLTKRFCWSLLRSLSGLGVRDITSGFRAYNRKAMEHLLSPHCLNLEYQDVGVLFTARAGGLKLAEVPVRMAPRAAQQSRVFPGNLSILRYLLITLIFILVRKP
ncbi:MAG: glycosyltransferase family 2 protein [Desulfobacteraceae bacterium]|jgi:glycosyltransferase involved in cell wall biosynthesis|nr:MAG: glycosyltransferase family 2 protein [Desulfobacteraceae bacterium]